MERLLGSRYVLTQVIGRGAMGEVWQGQTREDSERVAVKILRPELADDPALVARFVQERSILLALSHPNLVRVQDLVVEGDTLAIVMEFIDGGNLRSYLRSVGTLPPALAVRLSIQVLEGLSAVHDAGVVHRDLKPENVVLDRTDPEAMLAKLTDFGVSRITDGPGMTRPTGLIGTAEYMAPELAEHNAATPATDLYAVGILLYELLAGRTPFAGGHEVAVLLRHREASPEPIPGIQAGVWAVIESLLAKAPRQRPLNAHVVAKHLAGMLPDLAGVNALPPMGPPLPTGATPAWLSPLPGELDTAVVNQEVETHDGSRRRVQEPSSFAEIADDRETALGIRRKEAVPAAPAVQWWKRRSVKVGVPVAAVLIAGGVVAGVLLGSATSPATPRASTAHARSVSYSLNPVRYPNGVLLAQNWTLAGNGTAFRATLTATNPSAKAMTSSFEVAIPKNLAASASRDVHFAAPVPKIVNDDPVVEYSLPLAAHASKGVSYTVTAAPGPATTARLAAWATAATKTVLAGPQPTAVTIATLTVESDSGTTLTVGETKQLHTSGFDNSRKPVAATLLASAAWTSSEPQVATVSQTGQVFGITAGTTIISSQIGTTPPGHITITVVEPTASGGTINEAVGAPSATLGPIQVPASNQPTRRAPPTPVTSRSRHTVAPTRVTTTTVSVPPTITSTSVDPAQRGLPYHATLVASGSRPLRWQLVGGTLPRGLALDSSGQIHGTPSDIQNGLSFTVQVTNAGGDSTSRSFSLPSYDADFNGDGVVNCADRAIVLQNQGQSNVGFGGGDANLDGVVNVQDYNIWKMEFTPGQSTNCG